MGNTIISFHSSIMQEENIFSLGDEADYVRLALQKHASHLQQLLVEHPAATYYMQVEGTQNISLGIFQDDIVVIDRSLKPAPTDLVVGVADGEHVISGYAQFMSAMRKNVKQDDMERGNAEQAGVEIFGVVTGVIRPLRRTRTADGE